MLSRKAKYGVKALVELARAYGQGPVLVAELAKREHIPRKFLELILLELKNEGLLQSRRGRGGGYILVKPPDTVDVGRVVRTLDGPLALIPCVSETAYVRCEECPDERTCAVRLVMKEVRDSTARILDGTTLAHLLVRVDTAAGRVDRSRTRASSTRI